MNSAIPTFPVLDKRTDRGGDPPKHIAIIMDGNGRWACKQGLPRSTGHKKGVEALRRTVETAKMLGLSYLTVFSFSTENWRRSVTEVNALFALLKTYVRKDLDRLTKEGVCIRILGSRKGLPADVLSLITQAEDRTAHNSRFHLCIAFNYGGREEILRAAQAHAEAYAAGRVDNNLTQSGFETYLDTAGLPDPDLVIRTSGELRLSNFLIWQTAYAELVFIDVLWPDFQAEHLSRAIDVYRQRDRRFGGAETGAA